MAAGGYVFLFLDRVFVLVFEKFFSYILTWNLEVVFSSAIGLTFAVLSKIKIQNNSHTHTLVTPQDPHTLFLFLSL